MKPEAKIEMRAAEWLVRRDRGCESIEERQAFENWLAADAAHRRAYLELQRTWSKADELKTWIPHRGDIDPAILRAFAKPASQLSWGTFAMAASALMLCVVLGWFFWPRSATTYTTEVGGYQRVVLADGSIVQLNTDSSVRVLFTDQKRELHLLRGEAFFQVEKDPLRPFRVVAADKDVRAIGTAFSIRLNDPRSLEVTVTEGRVSIAPTSARRAPALLTPTRSAYPKEDTADRPKNGLIILTANQVASLIEAKVRVRTLSRLEANRRVAWQAGELSFQGETLNAVIAEFNRYNETHMELADTALGKLQVGGNFQATDLDSFMGALERSFGIHAAREGETIRLSRY